MSNPKASARRALGQLLLTLWIFFGFAGPATAATQYNDWSVECGDGLCIASTPATNRSAELRVVFLPGQKRRIEVNDVGSDASALRTLFVGASELPLWVREDHWMSDDAERITPLLAALKQGLLARAGAAEFSLRGSARALSAAEREARTLKIAVTPSRLEPDRPQTAINRNTRRTAEPSWQRWQQANLGHLDIQARPDSEVQATLHLQVEECLRIAGNITIPRPSSLRIKPKALRGKPIGYKIAGVLSNGFSRALAEFDTIGPPDDEGLFILQLSARNFEENPFDMRAGGVFSYTNAQAFFLAGDVLEIAFLPALASEETAPIEHFSPFDTLALSENDLMGRVLRVNTAGLFEAFTQRSGACE